MTQNELVAFIKSEKFAVLSWVNDRGTPESALVGIAVTSQLEIVFDTVKTSRKYGQLCARPEAAFVVGCSGDQTLQYEGTARELTGAELDRYKPVYFAAFPDGPSRQNWPAICYFILKPKWIRFSDYGETPRLIEEFSF